ncbi:MAG: solute carrier family 23 protein [Odoribacter splanchnicus]
MPFYCFWHILANRLLRGIWKSTVVLCSILAAVYLLQHEGFPLLPSLIPLPAAETHFWLWPLHFDGGVILSFFFCFIALIVNELGSIQAVGQMIGADKMEKRTTRGVGFIGLSNILSGICGIIGPVDYSMSPGIIAATGCASRSSCRLRSRHLCFLSGFIQILNRSSGRCGKRITLFNVLSFLPDCKCFPATKRCPISIAVSLSDFRLWSFNAGVVPHEVIDRILLYPAHRRKFVMGVTCTPAGTHYLQSPKQEKG